MKRAKNLFEKLVSDDNLLLAIDEVNRTHHWRTHHRPNSCTAWVEETKEERVKELRQIIIDGFISVGTYNNPVIQYAVSCTKIPSLI